MPDPFVPLDSVRNSLICDAGPGCFHKIYCKCGRIVDFDENEYETKVRLRKPIECSFCRNQRISVELDMLDEHFSIIEEEPAF
ncbi:hypothetical protein AUQ37_07765 [Candidatus Methanomethylophilus sp. 1R26]|uniref:hypothetical protein n=1 Tax=Candidatus Methanomethylophilus sp. 1R26 TaxID=1769296 RepID=UPI00073716F9|nr:hypothetical protein [Candidatus Methanomethylophilus sp. 1R26]KUE73776.1 hypothetical protein AUQ37_07765 [Candidatus Methanomethylophilus sp. 1R26]